MPTIKLTRIRKIIVGKLLKKTARTIYIILEQKNLPN